MAHSKPAWLYTRMYTLEWQDTPNITWVYAPMYAPVYLIQTLAELQVAGTRWRAASGEWWVAGGGWCLVAKIMMSIDIIVSIVSFVYPP